MEKVILKTEDGLDISALYYSNSSSKGVLLLHMMPATKESWRDFALKLQTAGYQILAIDLRGHGESSGGPDGFNNFSDEQHQKSILDIDAGIEFLEIKGVSRSNLVLIGASIGANLALQSLSGNKEIKKAILLSPGIDYRGIKTEPLMAKIFSDQKVMLVGSNNDSQSNNDALQKIASAAPENIRQNIKVVVYQRAGHGTDIFSQAGPGPLRPQSEASEPDLEKTIIEWLKQ